jgi:hypothetical protein
LLNDAIILKTQASGVLEDKALAKDAAGELIEAFGLNGFQQAHADASAHGNIFQRDLLGLALTPQSLAQISHCSHTDLSA